MLYKHVLQCLHLSDKFKGLQQSTKTQEKQPCQSPRRRSKQISKLLLNQWKEERSCINLLLLGPGEAGKSTLIKQMQFIHGEQLEIQQRMESVKYIRQNIFDSMLAILVSMRLQLHIQLRDLSLEDKAQCLLNHSQVLNPSLTSIDILNSAFLHTETFFDCIEALWEDEGVKEAYSRSNEYQLLDCAAYFFDRLQDIRKSDYIPSEQDVLRCRVMTTSITETRFTAPYRSKEVNFKVIDVGGQQGERRKWIALFDSVTAVLFTLDISSFNQTLREDSKTFRLLESLKVFHQVITTRYLRTVSILTFMNKIDILKDKMERGADFEAAINSITQQAYLNSLPSSQFNDHERSIYHQIYEILAANPYASFAPTEQEKQSFRHSFSQSEKHIDTASSPKIFKFTKKSKSHTVYEAEESRAMKAAAYIQRILALIECNSSTTKPVIASRSFLYYYTCAVDSGNIRKVLDGCKHILVKKYLEGIMVI